MKLEDLGPDALWRCYQRGYYNLIRSGIYFRQILRPVMSHTYFQRAMPLLAEYAEANRTESDLPPGFRERLDACPLTPRDLLHLDYAICLGYAELQGHDPQALAVKPVLNWPGLGGVAGVFVAADAIMISGVENFEDDRDEQEESDQEDGETKPPFDL